MKLLTEGGGCMFLDDEEPAYFLMHLWLLISLTRSWISCWAEMSSFITLLGMWD